MIEVVSLSMQYIVDAGSVAALHDVSLRVGAGERLGLFGPSGSGKTTLLRCIAGLEVPQMGVIRIDGVEVFDAAAGVNLPPWMRPIGVVFQDYALWPHMRVLDNVMFPLRHGRINTLSKFQQRERALEVLRKVRLEGLEERYPSELSGGQKQRVALARALASRPTVLLMDEPLSSLDPHLRKQTRNELVGILEESCITTIFVSHDHVDGLFMTNLVGIMRDGKLVQIGSPLDVFLNPVDAPVAAALDAGAVFRCEKVSPIDNDARYRLKGSQQSLRLPSIAAKASHGEHCFLLIPGGACSLWKSSGNNDRRQTLTGQVVREGYTGRGWCVLVSIEGISVEIWERDRPGLSHGDTVEVAVDAEQVQRLPA